MAGRAVPVLCRHGMAAALRLTSPPEPEPTGGDWPATPVGGAADNALGAAAAVMILRLLKCRSDGRERS